MFLSVIYSSSSILALLRLPHFEYYAEISVCFCAITEQNFLNDIELRKCLFNASFSLFALFYYGRFKNSHL